MATIISPRLTLEPLSLDHANLVYRAQLSSEIYRFISDQPSTLQELQKRYTFLEKAQSPDGTEHWLNWIAFNTTTREIVGTFQATVPANKEISIAYIVFPSFWRQGFAQEMGDAVITHLIEEYNPTCIFAEMDVRNQASIRLVEKLGFTRTNFTPNADFFKGETSDEYRYTLSLDDWLNRSNHG